MFKQYGIFDCLWCGCDCKGSHKTTHDMCSSWASELQNLIFCWLWWGWWGWQWCDYNNVMMVTMLDMWRIIKTSSSSCNLIKCACNKYWNAKWQIQNNKCYKSVFDKKNLCGTDATSSLAVAEFPGAVDADYCDHGDDKVLMVYFVFQLSPNPTHT